ncbi:MAG TPA: hypothetical protein VHX19_04530 [Stellaceae bacterium]|jgi:hypothetical protein|nr:hypothetical protein [Stellaceae bacterium]
MAAYRFYYLNERDHIIDAEWVFCPGDAVAMARAAGKLLMRRDGRAIEIWQGKRRVDAIATPRAAISRKAA